MDTAMLRRSMGIIHVKIRVFSANLAQEEWIEVLVDAGSTLTWIPEDAAIRLGIQPTGVALFDTADGRTLERPIADAPIECLGIRGYVGLVLARPGDAPVLGVTAMERLGLEVDPIRRMLRRTDRYLALTAAPHTPRGSVISP